MTQYLKNIEQPFKIDDFVSQELTYLKTTRSFINMMILYLKITTWCIVCHYSKIIWGKFIILKHYANILRY